MALIFPYMRRLLAPRTSVGNFSTEEGGNGVWNFDGWDSEVGRERFELMLRVWMTADGPVGGVNVAFVDADANAAGVTSNRMVVLDDQTGTLESFVEDNLGAWWIVPRLSHANDRLHELHITTSGAPIAKTINVEVAWVPRWPCSLADLLSTLKVSEAPRCSGA